MRKLTCATLRGNGRHAFSSLANASSTAGLLVAAAAACSVFSFACSSRSRRTAEIWNRRRNGQLRGLNGPLNGLPISGHLTAAAAQWLIFDGVDLRGRHGLIYVTRSSNVGDLAYAQLRLRRECDALPAMISPACFVGTSPSVVLDFATRFDSWHSRNSFHSARSAGHSARKSVHLDWMREEDVQATETLCSVEESGAADATLAAECYAPHILAHAGVDFLVPSVTLRVDVTLSIFAMVRPVQFLASCCSDLRGDRHALTRFAVDADRVGHWIIFVFSNFGVNFGEFFNMP